MTDPKHGVGCAALVTCIVLSVTKARADATQCGVDPLPTPHQTELPLLYEPRHDELTLEARYLGSWMPVVSSFDFGLRYSYAPFDQRLHLGLEAGGTAGEWGSDRRGPIALTIGGRVAYDFARLMTGVVDLYVLAEADALVLAKHGDPVLRPGVGLGLRVDRSIGVEATFNPLISLGDAFADGEKFDGGFGIGVSYDFCTLGTFCDEKSRTSIEHDLTPQFYAAAADVKPAEIVRQAALCDAVARALDAARYHPHDKIDSMDAFLRGVAENLTDKPLQDAVNALRNEHIAWLNDWTKSHEAERVAAADGHQLTEHCVYEPFPLELKSLFGCQ
ncbi:MAG TPA: hypothetical protein VHC69_09955 [Polyangiaceae bacterium]|nr:hypothetical protein [Polyangiaceae bacterium]